ARRRPAGRDEDDGDLTDRRRVADERRVHDCTSARECRPLHRHRDVHGRRSVIAAPPPVALTATPAHVALAGAAVQAITVANPGRTVAVVDARLAGFALDLHGRPRVVAQRDHSIVLSVAPRRFAIAPRATGTVLIASTIRSGAGVGDHVGLVLFTTQPRS